MSNSLKEMCPPAAVIEDPKMLTEEKLQGTLFSNPHRDKLNPAVQTLQRVLRYVKAASGDGFPISHEFKQAYKDALEIRAHVKTCIMLDWTLDNILNDKKTTPTELKAQAEEIQKMVAKTNVELPSYMVILLEKMAGQP